MNRELLETINNARSARELVVVITSLEDGSKELLAANELAQHPLADELIKRQASRKSGVVEHEGREVFIEMHVPSPRLVIIGAVHISQSLYPMAQACGYDVTIIDPRSAFATEERFGGVTLHADWPEVVMPNVPFDAFTAVVAVTHDPKIDDLPLQAALQAGCFYIGALGSRKTHATRLERFREAGTDESCFDRIHAPIGLNIGAANPAEIAVAVMAEIIEASHRGAVA